MSRLSFFLPLAASLLVTGASLAQVPTSTASCNFDDEKQVAVNYQHLTFNPKKPIFGRDIPYGKVWAPGHQPLTLFTNTTVEIGGKALPMGAYTMFVIPSPKQWTLIISKSTDMTGTYDEKQDIVRVTMESGELPSPQANFVVSFAHLAPDQCSIRFELDKTGNFALFQKR